MVYRSSYQIGRNFHITAYESIPLPRFIWTRNDPVRSIIKYGRESWPSVQRSMIEGQCPASSHGVPDRWWFWRSFRLLSIFFSRIWLPIEIIMIHRPKLRKTDSHPDMQQKPDRIFLWWFSTTADNNNWKTSKECWMTMKIRCWTKKIWLIYHKFVEFGTNQELHHVRNLLANELMLWCFFRFSCHKGVCCHKAVN